MQAEIDHYLIGFGRLYEDDAVAADASAPRLFSFTEASKYKTILVGDQQVGHIEEFERSNKTPVHYLLYNPSIVPWTQSHPLPATGRPPSANVVGCRVVPAGALRLLLGQSAAGSSPSYGELSRDLPSPFRGLQTRGRRRVEDFIERLITCKEGYRATGRDDFSLRYVFGGRRAPIAAAIGPTLSGPASVA